MNVQRPLTEKGPLVLVAYEPGDVQQQIVKLVDSLGYHPIAADDGVKAAEILKNAKPQLMVVDAGIEGRASFELCDFIQRKSLPTRVILVASVYRKTRYKRRPASLYGADDYVEQHHIHDMLPAKLSAALGGRGQ
jgi:CheY-like chemotaxis protein